MKPLERPITYQVRNRYPPSSSCRINGVEQPISDYLSGEERRIAHKMVDWEFSFEARGADGGAA